MALDLEGRVPPSVLIDGCLLSDGPVLQLSFILKIKENTFSRREGMLTQKTRREERERSLALWLLFLYVFSPSSAAAAKSLQSCPTLCDPIDSSPPGSPVPGILRARTLEWVAIAFSNA